MFVKYQHLERLGTDATDGILNDTVYAFPKLDGTNSSVWFDKDKGIQAGSRNRTLSLEADNAGFCKWAYDDLNLLALFQKHPNLRLYGEWLVPHSLKTYRDDAWRRFYVFDVMDDESGKTLTYDGYLPIMEHFGIDVVPCIAILKNPTKDLVYGLLERNTFLIKDNEGFGEGIVLKNYNYVNRYGHQIWAKIISNEFKEQHNKEMGAPILNGTLSVEHRIVDDFCTKDFVLKEQAKIINEVGEWKSPMIPRLLGTVYHELVKEEMWNIVKKYKNPNIDFNFLNKLVIAKTKESVGI